MTVPTNNEEAEAPNLLKYAVGLDHPTFGQGFFFTQDAVDSLISDVRRPPVSVDNAELIAELRNIECYYGGELRDWMRNAAKQAADILSASHPRAVSGDNAEVRNQWNDAEAARSEAKRRYSDHGEVVLTAGAMRNARRVAFEKGAEWQASQPREAAPSDVDLRQAIESALDPVAFRGSGEEVGTEESAVLLDDAINALLPLLSRTAHPVQVEVTDEMRAVVDELNAEISTEVGEARAEERQPSPITAVLGRARDALMAALGGGDHAE